MEHDKIAQALDTRLSNLHFAERNRSYVLNNLHGQRIVRRKLRLVLIAALLSVLLLAGAAMAVHSFFEYAQTLIDKQEVPGGFDAWPTGDKLELVTQLADAGYIDAGDSRFLQLQDAKPARVDELTKALLEEWTEQPIEYMSFTTVMETIWGPFRAWTPEQKAWQTQVFERAGRLGEDHERYVIPESEHVPAEQAMHIAMRVYTTMMGIPQEAAESALTPYADFVIYAKNVPNPAYETGESPWPTHYSTEGVLPVWSVSLYDNARRPGWERIEAYVSVDPLTGKPQYDSLIYKIFHEQYGATLNGSFGWKVQDAHERLSQGSDYDLFARWSLDAKAAWTDEMRTLVQERLAEKPEKVDFYTRAMATYAYGLPEEGDIAEAAARALAVKALANAYGVTEDILARHELFTHFDVTDPDRPLWRFCFDQTTRMELDTRENYRVQIDAHSGEIVSTERYNPDGLGGEDAILRLL